MQRTQWRSRTTSWKFWRLDHSRSQGPQWQLRISKQSPVCSRGAGLSHPMDPGISVQDQNFTRNPEKLANSSWNPRGNQKSFTLTIPWNSMMHMKISWNHCTSTPHRSETNGIAERAVRRVKEGTPAVLLQSGLDESWWADSMECYTYLRNVTDLLSDGKTPYERRFGELFKGPVFPFGSLFEYYPISANDQPTNPSFWKDSVIWIVPWIRSVRGGNLEGWHHGCRHWVGNEGRIRNLLKKIQCKGSNIFQRKWKIHFSSRRSTNKIYRMRSGTENISLDTGPPNSRRRSRRFCWRIRRVSSTTSWLTSGCRWSDKWLLVHVRKLHIPASRWIQESNFARREKNHSPFHWNTLTSPGQHLKTWMFCKKAASVIIGISMDQEMCRILGQVSPIYSFGRLQIDVWGSGRDWQDGR